MKLTMGDRVLDANFDVELIDDSNQLALTLESRKGAARNPDYTYLLHALLRALCDVDATITSVEVVSRETQGLRPSERQLPLRYPLRLGATTDFGKLKDRIGDLQRRVNSTSSHAGGGNRTRRLKITCRPMSCTSHEFLESLGDSRSIRRRRAFVLLWNPEHWPMEKFLAELADIRGGSTGQWSTGKRKSGVFEGDLVLLLRIGQQDKGLIGVGTARSHDGRDVECIFMGRHWGNQAGKFGFVNIDWNHLVHPDDKLPLSDFSAEFPQVSWRHLQGSGTLIPSHIGDSLLGRFQAHVAHGSLESPEVADARAELDALAGKEILSSSKSRRSRRAPHMTAEQRRSIELHAMTLAKSHLKKRGWTTVIDTSSGNPFDFHCKRSRGEIWVEVKGTTSNGASVVLTKNEVSHHRSKYPKSCLIIVHGIRLTGARKSEAVGGNLVEYCPWKIDENDLDPIGFDYTTGL
jgi:hypothetical protein